MNPRIAAALVVAGLAASDPASAADRALLDAKTLGLLHEELSGELAKEHVIAITRHHRIQGSRGYRSAAKYVLERLREFGFDEKHAWIESFPSDGRVEYGTWQSPSGFDIESGELRLVKPRDERIVGYPEIAMSVMTYSNAGDVTAPLVWVGRGTSDADYAGKDVRGKFVLATGYGGAVHREAVVKRGAAAVVCYLDDARAKEWPDMLQYTGMWPRAEELEKVTFGFNLTNRQGERLRAMLDAGEEVVVRGRVDGIGLEPYFMDVVVATIDGSSSPSEEIVLSAHLDHPKESANDNASGSAALIDMARSLTALRRDGRLPAPGRTLRFLWVPEFYGTMAYLVAHPEMEGKANGGKVLANLNLDMVGENTELLHCHMALTRSPLSNASALDAVIADMAAAVDRLDVRTPRGSLSDFNYRLTPYASGSDHMIFLDRMIPSTMFWHDPDYTHHTSEDTPDKVDPVELERSEILAAGAAWVLANPSPATTADLAFLAAGDAARIVAEHARRAATRVAAAPPGDGGGRDVDRALAAAWAEARSTVEHGRRAAARVVASLADFDPRAPRPLLAALASGVDAGAAAHAAAIDALATERGLLVPAAGAPAPAFREVDARVPSRTGRGPLEGDVLERRLPADRFAWYESEGRPISGDVQFEILNFVDGKRDVTAIRDAVSAEFEPIETRLVARFLDDLATAGVIAWK